DRALAELLLDRADRQLDRLVALGAGSDRAAILAHRHLVSPLRPLSRPPWTLRRRGRSRSRPPVLPVWYDDENLLNRDQGSIGRRRCTRNLSISLCSRRGPPSRSRPICTPVQRRLPPGWRRRPARAAGPG